MPSFKNICISTNKPKLSLLFPITLLRTFSQNCHWSPDHYPAACVILHQIPWSPVYLARPRDSNRLTTYNGQLRLPPFESLAEQSQNIPSPPLVLGPKKTQRLLRGRGAGMTQVLCQRHSHKGAESSEDGDLSHPCRQLGLLAEHVWAWGGWTMGCSPGSLLVGAP